MNASQLVQQISENPQLLKQQAVLLKKLSPAETIALVPELVQAFKDHKLWPKDAADIIAACRPTDEQLLDLLNDDGEPCQKLGLHILALLIGNQDFVQGTHKALAYEALQLLQREVFRPKLKHLKSLKDWTKSQAA